MGKVRGTSDNDSRTPPTINTIPSHPISQYHSIGSYPEPRQTEPLLSAGSASRELCSVLPIRQQQKQWRPRSRPRDGRATAASTAAGPRSSATRSARHAVLAPGVGTSARGTRRLPLPTRDHPTRHCRRLRTRLASLLVAAVARSQWEQQRRRQRLRRARLR